MSEQQTTLSKDLRTQIILAAINSVGEQGADPAAWHDQIREAVVDITLLVGDKSPLARLVDQTAGARAFRTIILDVKKEASSQRGHVTMRSKPTKFAKDGIEYARTERMDVKGSPGHKMAVKLRELKGHHVTIWIYMETPANGGNDVRMVAAVRDEGVATQEEIDGTAQQAAATA